MIAVEMMRAEIAAQNLRRVVENHATLNTQERFAEAMHVDVRTVRRWYKMLDSLTLIKQAADVLGISDLDLLLEN